MLKKIKKMETKAAAQADEQIVAGTPVAEIVAVKAAPMEFVVQYGRS